MLHLWHRQPPSHRLPSVSHDAHQSRKCSKRTWCCGLASKKCTGFFHALWKMAWLESSADLFYYNSSSVEAVVLQVALRYILMALCTLLQQQILSHHFWRYVWDISRHFEFFFGQSILKQSWNIFRKKWDHFGWPPVAVAAPLNCRCSQDRRVVAVLRVGGSAVLGDALHGAALAAHVRRGTVKAG